jgi:hypothetical protein
MLSMVSLVQRKVKDWVSNLQCRHKSMATYYHSDQHRNLQSQTSNLHHREPLHQSRTRSKTSTAMLRVDMASRVRMTHHSKVAVDRTQLRTKATRLRRRTRLNITNSSRSRR